MLAADVANGAIAFPGGAGGAGEIDDVGHAFQPLVGIAASARDVVGELDSRTIMKASLT
jgi:hypothetical protein